MKLFQYRLKKLCLKCLDVQIWHQVEMEEIARKNKIF